MHNSLERILEEVKVGQKDISAAVGEVRSLFYQDLGHTVLDMDRKRRTGHGEVVYCEGKQIEQIRDILQHMSRNEINILGTRMSHETYEQLKDEFPQSRYDPTARLFTMIYTKPEVSQKGYVAVVSAGTSDSGVAEEAAKTLEFYGHEARRFNDVGVAGIHRLFRHIDEIRGARVVIAVAGMEGALASVVGGLVDAPVIAVPTSVGYGANFHGISALLAMLNSCSSGISVVNIDNGFGAGYLAAMINGM